MILSDSNDKFDELAPVLRVMQLIFGTLFLSFCVFKVLLEYDPCLFQTVFEDSSSGVRNRGPLTPLEDRETFTGGPHAQNLLTV